MKTQIITVTPKMAQSWLNTKTENRNINKGHVRFLADEILAGRWRLTHQGIAFSDDGQLVDGQHRLTAIVEAGIATTMMVTFDVPIVDFPLFDRGMSRNMSVITGIPNFFTEAYIFMITAASGRKKASPDDVCLLHKKLANDFISLRNASAAHAKFFTSAPVRAAAVVSMKIGENPSYVLGVYQKLASGKPRAQKALPLVAIAFRDFYVKMKSRNNAGGGGWRAGLYTRARYVFTKANENREKIQIGEVLQEQYSNDCCEVVEQIFGANPFTTTIAKQVELERRKTRQVADQLAAVKTAAVAMRINAENSRLSMEAKD